MTTLDQAKADAIAALFFDKHLVRENQPQMSRLFGLRAATPIETRHLTADEAMQRMRDMGYTPADAQRAMLVLDRFSYLPVMELGGKKFREGADPIREYEYSRGFYLGIAVTQPAIDLRTETEFLSRYKNKFSALLLEDFNRPQPGVTCNASVNAI